MDVATLGASQGAVAATALRAVRHQHQHNPRPAALVGSRRCQAQGKSRAFMSAAAGFAGARGKVGASFQSVTRGAATSVRAQRVSGRCQRLVVPRAADGT